MILPSLFVMINGCRRVRRHIVGLVVSVKIGESSITRSIGSVRMGLTSAPSGWTLGAKRFTSLWISMDWIGLPVFQDLNLVDLPNNLFGYL